MNLLCNNQGAVHGYRHRDRRTCHTAEQGQAARPKPPLRLKEIWAIRIRLQLTHRFRELALFNLAIDSKLRGWTLAGLHVYDVVQGSPARFSHDCDAEKTQRPVQFEITEQTRDAVAAWIAAAHLKPLQFLFPSPHIGLASSLDSAVLPDCRVMGGIHWTGPGGLRHAFTATHESHADLPEDQESPSRSAFARAHET